MIYEFTCIEGHGRDVFEHHRDDLGADTVICDVCGNSMGPLPSYGRGLLFFEEGRGRWIHNLGDKPVYITSTKQHEREMKRAGVALAGTIPTNTKFSGRASEKGRWL